MKCPKAMKVPVGIADGKIVYETQFHEIRGKGIVECSKCGGQWCCMECAIECDALGHEDFDKIYDREGEVPNVFYVECCKCSGKRRCYEDRECFTR